MSDVLIINLFEQSIGLNNAGSIPLLQRVMEASLMMKTRKENVRTTLLVLIRDYKPKMIPLEKHIETINEIINDIWESIQKPKGEENLHWQDCFELVVHGIADIIPEEEIEEERVQDVKNIFHQKNHRDYLFRNKKDRLKGFLMKELDELIPQIWSEICLNKNLDIISQREFIFHKRCDDVKKEVLESVKSKITKLEKEVKEKKKNMKELTQDLKRLEKEWIEEFEEKAPHYLEKVYNNKLEELKKEINENFSILYVIAELVQLEIKVKGELSRKSIELKELQDRLSKKHGEILEMVEKMKNKEKEYEKIKEELKKETEERIKAEIEARNQQRKTHEQILQQQEILAEKERNELKKKHEAEMSAMEMRKQEEMMEIERKHTAEMEEEVKETQKQIGELERRIIEAERARIEAEKRNRRRGFWGVLAKVVSAVAVGMLL
jgi:myosin heavy subunit